MPRPIWKGFISFGLVNIPVSLHPAEKPARIQFHLVDSRNHSRIHYARINDDTGKEVPWNKVAKAYEFEKGNYVVLEDEEVKSVAIKSSQTIDIINFVEEKEVSDVYFDKPYYLVPEKKALKGYVLLREALERSGKIGIAKVMIRTREHLCAVEPCGNSLLLNLLRYSNEIIPAKNYEFPEKKLSDYKITAQEIKLSEQLINEMTTKWNPKLYKDDYQTALMKVIEKKIKIGRLVSSSPLIKSQGDFPFSSGFKRIKYQIPFNFCPCKINSSLPFL